MKTMLEGKGGMVRNLYQAFSKQFTGCAFLFGSNGLPDISKAHLFPDRYREDWGPIVKRTRFVYMAESFTGKTFGYDASILAHAIRALLPARDLPELEVADEDPREAVVAVDKGDAIGLDDLLAADTEVPALILNQATRDPKFER
jgi:hypothetical protein